jgi:PKHD-type hydroxylase
MQYEVFRLIEHGEAARLVQSMAQVRFVDGKSSASGRARDIKHNLQAPQEEGVTSEPEKAVLAAFDRHEDFQAFALPQRMTRPMFSRYEPGMHYGPHVDSTFMGGLSGVRSDLAMTLFLSPPSTYDGGELIIEHRRSREAIKLDAGEAIVYSASSIHHVAPVTRGVRLAAITWIQSVVRDESLRSILYDLVHAVRQAEEAQHSYALSLTQCYGNLLRYAAQP